jgi:hypothetical protein
MRANTKNIPIPYKGFWAGHRGEPRVHLVFRDSLFMFTRYSPKASR